ncbi:Acetyl esterase/lipase [Rubritalea squalenifaciens DSM 18772]|uniref:Acetyl esterase/lipase n=1 Tax=Rubritalea squalenifaciens DSM 18772 TaxID=1123071 RepID=A0A1M6PUC3_9BACT|nr:sialate O-acetylesterase [Rubritalea squalenifaciens]SHK11531.1 Acetyl esterase/lipase [Rubritalea squalenifaciens DSM 18772]
MKLLCYLTLAFLPFLAKAAEVDVYLLGGQSNMQGIGKLKNLPKEYHKAVKNTFIYRGQNIAPLVIGQTQTSHRKGEMGPEIGFALNIQSDKPVYLLKYAASGMPLNPGWNGNKWLGGKPGPKRTNFYPGLTPEDPNKGRLYRAMLDRFQKGIEAIKAEGHTPVIKGFVWMQGEQDSKNEVSANSYAKHLKLLRDRLAEDVKVSRLPMVYGQVLPHEPALERFTHRENIRSQMAAADMASGKPEAIRLAKMISTDGFTLLKDTVHYDANGQLKLGSEMAKAMNHLQGSGKQSNLWPDRVPGFPEDFEPQAHKQLDPGHITETSQPTITVYPAMGKPTGQALVIFPGGGYRVLADMKEGENVAAYYAARGITSFVVRYRVTKGSNEGFRFPGPLLDARQGIRIAKASAENYGFNPEKVGVIGFSAGGHLASMCATRFGDSFEGELNTDISVKPNFAALIYPVASMVAPSSHKGSRHALFGKDPQSEDLKAASPELLVKKDFPPVFIAQNQFDPVDAKLSFILAQAYTAAQVPCELHIFPGKDHGYGMGRPGQTEAQNPAIAWPELLHKFILKAQ